MEVSRLLFVQHYGHLLQLTHMFNGCSFDPYWLGHWAERISLKPFDGFLASRSSMELSRFTVVQRHRHLTTCLIWASRGTEHIYLNPLKALFRIFVYLSSPVVVQRHGRFLICFIWAYWCSKNMYYLEPLEARLPGIHISGNVLKLFTVGYNFSYNH